MARFICFWISINIFLFQFEATTNTDLPGEPLLKSSPSCYRLQASEYLMVARCLSQKVIAMQSVTVAIKPTTDNCLLSDYNANRLNFFESPCCQNTTADDCVFDDPTFKGGSLMSSCNGRQTCSRTPQWYIAADIPNSAGCVTGVYPVQPDNYMHLNYHCIETSRIYAICEESHASSNETLFVQSPGYPSSTPNPPSPTHCSCLVQTDNCDSGIDVYLVEITLTSTLTSGSCSESQRLQIFFPDGAFIFTCENNTNQVIKQTVESPFFLVNFTYSLGDGKFWIGFKPTSNGNITISCPVGDQVSTFCAGNITITTEEPPVNSTNSDIPGPSDGYKKAVIGLSVVLGLILLACLVLVIARVCHTPTKRSKKIDPNTDTSIVVDMKDVGVNVSRPQTKNTSTETMKTVFSNKETKSVIIKQELISKGIEADNTSMTQTLADKHTEANITGQEIDDLQRLKLQQAELQHQSVERQNSAQNVAIMSEPQVRVVTPTSIKLFDMVTSSETAMNKTATPESKKQSRLNNDHMLVMAKKTGNGSRSTIHSAIRLPRSDSAFSQERISIGKEILVSTSESSTRIKKMNRIRPVNPTNLEYLKLQTGISEIKRRKGIKERHKLVGDPKSFISKWETTSGGKKLEYDHDKSDNSSTEVADTSTHTERDQKHEESMTTEERKLYRVQKCVANAFFENERTNEKLLKMIAGNSKPKSEKKRKKRGN